ncbi:MULTISPECIES: hypothetical protein [unclassified Moorena]|uniref:hypothetical protein n=1 Tax=unclassified Moorena TaxID=2683338 RepID=UPI0013CC6BE5|nr:MULTISPECIES: hypothetical protein [unclassified Moorena]NEO20018.1 hypothetical protein [Moorena sp. SIO4A5]NEQ61787.1 hypothetical protein [Moorena sp. SIO4A1]
MKQPCLKKGGSHTQSPPFLRGTNGGSPRQENTPYSLLPIPYSLLPAPCSLLPTPFAISYKLYLNSQFFPCHQS